MSHTSRQNTLLLQGEANEKIGNAKFTYVLEQMPDNINSLIGQGKIIGYNEEYFFLSLLTVASAAIGNRRISYIGSYTVLPIIYAAIVGNPSVNKSEPLAFAIKPLQSINLEKYKAYEAAMNDFNASDGNGIKPKFYPKVIQDTTFEAVISILSHCQDGSVVCSDELAGFFKSFGRYNAGNDLQHWLSLFKGEPITVTRATKESTYIEKPICSLIGTIQPDVLYKQFKNSDDNGFLERFLFSYPDNVRALPTNLNSNIEARNSLQNWWAEIIAGIQNLDIIDEKPIPIPFTSDALETYISWENSIVDRINDDDIDAAILGKFRIIAPRLALVIQIFENPNSGEITNENTIAAIVASNYFICEAMKVKILIINGASREKKPKPVLLFEKLPEIFTTKEAIIIGKELGISERQVKKYLAEKNNLFERKGQGEYTKVQPAAFPALLHTVA